MKKIILGLLAAGLLLSGSIAPAEEASVNDPLLREIVSLHGKMLELDKKAAAEPGNAATSSGLQSLQKELSRQQRVYNAKVKQALAASPPDGAPKRQNIPALKQQALEAAPAAGNENKP